MSDIMMIEGLVGFGDLGADIEEDMFAPMTDESRPLYDGEDDYAPLPDDFTPGDIAPVDPEYAEQYGIDPAEAKVELQQILDDRRRVVEEAVVERKKEEAKVDQIDKQVTETLPAAVQAAVQTGDQQRAQWLAYQQQMLQQQRIMAARRVIDLAKLQVVGSQMAKNTKAQIAIATLYEQAKEAGDLDVARELSSGYEAIGQMTQQYKKLRERQASAGKAATLKKELQNRQRAVILLRGKIAKVTRGRPPETLTKGDAAQYRTLQRALEKEQAGLEVVRAKMQEAKSEAEYVPEVLEGFVDGLGGMEPYCSAVERSSGGWFTCNAIKQVDLSGVGDLGDMDGAGSSIKHGLGEALKAIGVAGKYVAEKAVCPLGTSINKTIDKAAKSADEKKGEEEGKKGAGIKTAAKGIAVATGYGTAAVVAADAVSKMCKSDAPTKGPSLIIEGRRGLPWWLIPAGVVVAGGGLALYLATRPSGGKMQGLGRLPQVRRKRRRRRARARKMLGCGC